MKRTPSPGTPAARPNAYIVTGPTSGIGRATALELAKHGTIVLVGRNRQKLGEIKKFIEAKGHRAVPIACDLSDLASARRAAREIAQLNLPIAGLLNNAGIMKRHPTSNGQGVDLTFATNHLGPVALTQALMPSLPDGANIVFVVSAVEDPERKPAVAAGFRGGRYISAAASARGEWQPGGSKKPGFDAYATSKQALLASAMALSRENPRLRVNAIEPGFTPTTGLGSADVGAFVRLVQTLLLPLLVPLLMPFMKILSTPKRSARVITGVLISASRDSGVYYDERGNPMQGSALVRDAHFQDRVLAETRTLLASN